MNNRFYIAILALAILFAGCSKTDVATPKDKAVAFQVGSYVPQTKAAPEGTASLFSEVGDAGFKSKAFLHAEGLLDNPQSFFGNNGETITYNGTDAWLPSRDYFWPKASGSYINFISWVGGTPIITYTKGSEADAKWTATFAWNDVDVATTDNLLWADMAWRYKDNVNPAIYGFDNVAEGVPTLFHRALAQIRFLGKLYKAIDTRIAWEVNITKLSLSDVYNVGSLSLTAEDPGVTGTTEWTEDGWTTSGTATEIETEENASVPITFKQDGEEGDTIIGWTNVIPQAAADMNLTIDFTVKTTYTLTSGTKVVEENVSKTVALSQFSNSPSEWVRGHRITYTVVIDPDTRIITIIPVENNWEGGDEYLINIE